VVAPGGVIDDALRDKVVSLNYFGKQIGGWKAKPKLGTDVVMTEAWNKIWSKIGKHLVSHCWCAL
jgi:hypothetical protein